MEIAPSSGMSLLNKIYKIRDNAVAIPFKR